MKNISFFYTVPQFKDRSKDVTRRLGWHTVKAGDMLQAVVKCQGLKRGEQIERLGVIRVLSVRREPLNAITWADCAREGFPDLSPAEFIMMFCKMNNCEFDQVVSRIEYEYL